MLDSGRRACSDDLALSARFVTWDIDFTTQAREDLVGLEAEITEVITDTLIGWLDNGPSLEGERTLAGIRFCEASIAERVLLGYTVDRERRRFALLWVRSKPGSGP